MKICCQTITYRLRNSVSPGQVSDELGVLLEKHGLEYARCLWRFACPIVEYEWEGKRHSNREKNGVLRICKDYPQLASFYQLVKAEERSEWHVLANHTDCVMTSDEDHRDVIMEVLSKIPRPYSVADLEVVLDNVDFLKKGQTPAGIRCQPFGAPIGSYIQYLRYACGNERHTYLLLSVEGMKEDEDMIPFRVFFHELCERLPGTYQGTETR